MHISEITWDPSIYPRNKWNTATVARYADSMLAGDSFPAIVVEAGTKRLLDGKHRLLAYEKAGIENIPVEEHTIPEGIPAKLYCLSLSMRHGDRPSNSEAKTVIRETWEKIAEMKAPGKLVSQMTGYSESTVSGYVSDLLAKKREGRRSKALRLSLLGWTQADIAERLGVSRQSIGGDLDAKNFSDELFGSGHTPDEIALRIGLPVQIVRAIQMREKTDAERMAALEIKVQPYDVWNFSSCHDLMGDNHPGRIPGELVTHVMYFYTEQGDLVIDPMAGSGTTLDAALLMGRKARGYDIDHRHERIDIEKHDLSEGWPDTVSKAKLIFWDPPYYDKMDSGTIGEDGYIEGSISGMSPDEYVAWISARFAELIESVKSGTRIAFLMSDWDPENAKRHADHPGIYQWDYAREMQNAGWQITRQIQCPLGTQQVHPDIVNKFRESKRLARLGRYLLIGVKP